MAKPRIQSRVDESQKRRIEQYADENELTQAEAVRYLTFRGLDYEAGKLQGSSDDPPSQGGTLSDKIQAGLLTALAVLVSIQVFASFGAVTVVAAIAAGALVGVGLYLLPPELLAAAPGDSSEVADDG